MGKAMLFAVVGFAIILGTILFTQNSNILASADELTLQYYQTIRTNSLESGANVAVSKLFQDFDWRTGFSNLSFSGTNYSVSLTQAPVDSVNAAKIVTATIISNYENKIDTTTVVLMQPAYSYFSYYSQQWPGHITYSTGDTLLFPIHSDAAIKISGQPVFLGKVSSSEATYNPIGSPDPKFYGGADFGTPAVPLPDFNALKDSALAAGDQYNQELWLTFNNDGTYQCSTSTLLTLKNITDYNGTIITTTNQDIHVKGAVRGRITVVSDRDLIIEGNLVYDSNPSILANSTDYTGLTADRDLIIADTPATSAGVTVQAAILIRNDMKVENYNLGAPRGTLTLYGSIGQRTAQPFGTFLGGILQTGYDTSYIYDRRLFNNTPPFFPRLARIEQIYRSN